MFISQSHTRAESPRRVLARALPVSEWAAGGGGQALPALRGVARRQMGQGQLKGLEPLAPETPARYVLRPKAVVSRARMVRLSVAWKKLSPIANAARAWELMQRFFPERVANCDPRNLALDTLPVLLRLVEGAGWFEVDWTTWEYFDEIGYYEDDDREPWEQDWGTGTALDMLACLEYIPVKRYNFSMEEWFNSAAEVYPLPAIIKSIVDPKYGQRMGYWKVEAHTFRERCQVVADEKGPPFDILPTIVNYVLEQTGNDLLDNHSDPSDMDWPYGLGYKWDSAEDIETLKRLSAEATPVWQRITKLCEYLDTQDALETLIEEILYDTGTEDD